MKIKKLSFIYFDVGGVVIQDFSGTNKWSQLKRELGIKKLKNLINFGINTKEKFVWVVM